MERYIKEENKMGYIRDEIIKFLGGVPKKKVEKKVNRVIMDSLFDEVTTFQAGFMCGLTASEDTDDFTYDELMSLLMEELSDEQIEVYNKTYYEMIGCKICGR